MKSSLRYFTIFLLLAACTSCNAQIMKSLNDAQKIKENEQLFIGKPLKNLLDEISPKIKMVSANPGVSNRLGRIIFRFIDAKDVERDISRKSLP